MSESNIGISKFLIILFIGVLGVTILLLGFYFFRSSFSKTSSPTLLNNVVNKNNSETVLEFSSHFPAITFTLDDKQKSVLNGYLQKLDLASFQNKAFIGSRINKDQPAFISPKKITVIFSDLASLNEDEKADTILTGRKIFDIVNFETFFAGSYDTKTEELIIPVYLKRDELLKSKKPELLVSQIGLEALFLNFRNTPVESLGNPTDAFYKQVGILNTPIVIISGLK